MSAALTVSGSGITDLARANALAWLSTQSGGSTDGETVPAGFGVWRAGTNLFRHGQCDTIGDIIPSHCTVSIDPTRPAPFSPQSIKSIMDGVGQGDIRFGTATGQALAAGTNCVGSLWVLLPLGAQYKVGMIVTNTDASSTSTLTTIAGTGSWQQLIPTPVSVAAGKTGDTISIRLVQVTAHAETAWAAHAMIEAGVAAVSPYVATSGGATATRAAARVQAPATLLDETQCWAAFRIAYGFASTAARTDSNILLYLGDDSDNDLVLELDTSNRWQAFRRASGVGAAAVSAAQTFAADDHATVIFACDAGHVKVSVNGGAFVTVANTSIPTLAATLLDLASQAGTAQLNGRVLWAMTGIGPIGQAAATALNALGDTYPAANSTIIADPTASPATFLWTCFTTDNGLFWSIDGGRGILPFLSVELDVTNAPTNPTRAWTDITTDVRSLNFTRAGRMDELQQTQPGTLTTVVGSKNAKYDPTNPTGIGIRRTQWLRVRAQRNGVIYSRWQGIIENISQAWPQAGYVMPAVTITAKDAMKVLTLFDLKGQTFTSQTTDARVSAICALAGISASIDDAGISTLIPAATAFPKQSYADQHLQQVEQTENGLIFAGPDGTIHFQSRHYRQVFSAIPKAVIGDTYGALLYRDKMTVDSDDVYLVNFVTVTPTNTDGSLGTDQTASDATSETNHFQRSSSTVDRTILVSDVNEAINCAEYLLLRYKEPSPRIPAVEVIGSQVGRRAAVLWPTVLAANNSDRFTFKRSASNVIQQDCFVEKISETIVPQTAWDITFQLSPADSSFGWVLGDAVNGVLGSTTILSY